jgi:predicted AAA+ superfamily ATPase
MYNRKFIPPDSAYFLFGPRGTGKSTWVRSHYPEAVFIDLLPTKTALSYQRNPDQIIQETLALQKDRWIVLDEIQRVPELLNDVHALMENHGYRQFVLTGSSARKLKRGASNLLAGRAITRHLFPLNGAEVDFSIPPEQIMEYGNLPGRINLHEKEHFEDFLTAYVDTYISEEIKSEGLVRNIGNFARFLDVAALAAGTQINSTGLARDAGIGRDTVRGYFSVFEDTLLGSWLPAYRPRAKVKEAVSPKFYWFDSGVLNAAAGAFRQPMPSDWQGVLMEHWIHHEIRSYLEYSRSRGSLGFWRTPSGSEIDFVWWYGDDIVPIEVKSSKDVRPSVVKSIRSLSEHKKIRASYVVYRGEKELRIGDTWVLPAISFLKKLHAGEILGAA